MKKLVMPEFYGYMPKIAIEKTRIIGITLLNKEKIIKEGYKQLCLACQFGGINTIGFTQTLANIKEIKYEKKYCK